jgi:pSer/pThr/pTyr-binding forkhead associated (FHA) protein
VDWLEFQFSEAIIVGASDECDVVIKDGGLSEKHFEIRENPIGVFLKDLDPANGETTLHGKELPADHPLPLPLGEVLMAGDYEFMLTLADAEANEHEALTGKSSINQVKGAVQQVGIGKLLVFGCVLAIVGVIGALVIFSQFFKSPEAISSITTTVTTEVIKPDDEEAKATLEPTASFSMAATVVVEAINQTVTAPGLGEFNLGEIVLDASTLEFSDFTQFGLSQEALLSMATTLYGENVGYAYIYAGFEKDGKFLASSMEFIEAELGEWVGGVYVPDWPEDGEIPLTIEWEPFSYDIHDGETTAVGLLVPTIYGADEDEQIYRLDGIYRPRGSNSEYTAMIQFNADGSMRDMLTFGKVGEERVLPYKVMPNPGDTFIIYDKEFVHDDEKTEEMALDLSGADLPLGWELLLTLAIENAAQQNYRFGIGEFDLQRGATLTFSENDLWWTKNVAPDGNFVVGLAVVDLDGNYFIGYLPVSVIP